MLGKMSLTPRERVIKICDELPFDKEMREAIKEGYSKRSDVELEEFIARYGGSLSELTEILRLLEEVTKKS